MNENSPCGPEELRFVYTLILNGLSDSDILSEYIRLSSIGQFDFPLRTGSDFIKERRVELEAASEVLEVRNKKITEPLTMKRRYEHFKQLAKISDILLQDNLHTIDRNDIIDNSIQSGYVVEDNLGFLKSLNRWQLVNLFTKNVGTACEHFTPEVFHQIYIPHLKSFIPEMKIHGFWQEVERHPYEVIIIIKQLVLPKALKGESPLCQDRTDLLPFVSSMK